MNPSQRGVGHNARAPASNPAPINLNDPPSTKPTAISQPVPIDLRRMKLSRAAIVVAVSVPPTRIGFDSQSKIAVTAPAARPSGL
jgi:hypothetical protein